MNDRELLEFIAAQVGKLTGELTELKSVTEGNFNELSIRVDKIANSVSVIEKEHGDKLQALFDGWKQSSDQLQRIESEISKHEEIILRRVK